MKITAREIFPIVLGLADGTCTALVLASQKMSSGGMDLWQAFRIGIITSATGFLPLWVAEYAGLSFVGAAIPLSVAVLFPRLIYLPLVAANMTLMGVGLTLGLWVQGARWKWALGLMGIGDILALLGYKVGLS